MRSWSELHYRLLKGNDFVLLKLKAKNRVKYFIGLIQQKEADGCDVSFLRK
jgi:hypothetical protein